MTTTAASMLSRRRFLAGGAAAVALAMPAVSGGRAAVATARDWCLPSDAAWRSLAAQLGIGHLLRPGEDAFARRAPPQNLRYARVQPQAIARCTTPEDVAFTVQWCRDLDMPFAIRGGGHSYAGHSTSSGILIDVAPMNAVQFDDRSGWMTVGAGALNRDVADGMRRSSRIVTHGRCPGVGIAGFLLGGGIGFNMRRFGIGSDRLVAAELVTADGRLRRVSLQDDPALFWALRGGGGGNFGVSTAFTLETRPVDPLVTVFSVRWTENLEAVLEALLPALERAPPALGCRFSLGAKDPQDRRAQRAAHLDLLGQYAGRQQDLLDVLTPAIQAASPARTTIDERDYWRAEEFLSTPGDPGFYQERSGFVRRGLSLATLDRALRWLNDWPGTGASADIRFFQTGGAVNGMAPEATAFVHRDSEWLFAVGLNWTATDHGSPRIMRAARAWQEGFYAEMQAMAGTAAYQNFPDPSLVDWREAYYGSNLARLQRIKSRVDPSNVFRHAQSL